MLKRVTGGIVTAGIVSPGKFAPKILKGGISVKLGMIVIEPHPTVHMIDDAVTWAEV
jgi:hypothetical protein